MDEMHSIMQRLALIESQITPDSVTKGLNAQQRSVPQMPALFKMPAQGPVLGGDPDKKAPSAGYMVGASEGEEVEEKVSDFLPKKPDHASTHKLVKGWRTVHGLDEEVASEDKLDKVKKSFADYLDSISNEKQDTDLKDRVKADTDLKKKDKKDHSIVAKQITAVAEDPTEEDPIIQMPTTPMQNPVYGESAPVKTVALEDGRACEIHGDEGRGFEIRHGGRSLKSRFKNLDQAQMALEMYQARQRKQNESADYIEEA